MDSKDFYLLGYILKPTGNKGALSIQLDSGDPDYYQDLKEIYIELNGQFIKYPVKSISVSGNRAKVEFVNIDSPELAKLLQGRSLYMPLDYLPKLNSKQFYFHEVTGYEVYDDARGLIGIVQTVIDQTSQAILQIEFDDKEILIPITDEIIKKIDRKKKQLHIQAPDGLIDLYLE